MQSNSKSDFRKIPMCPLRPSDAHRIEARTEKISEVAIGGKMIEMMAHHSDPVVRHAAGVLHKNLFEPYSKYISQTLALEVTECDEYSVRLQRNEPGRGHNFRKEINVGGSTIADVSIVGAADKCFVIRQVDDEDKWELFMENGRLVDIMRQDGTVEKVEHRGGFGLPSKANPVSPGDVIKMGLNRIKLLPPEEPKAE